VIRSVSLTSTAVTLAAALSAMTLSGQYQRSVSQVADRVWVIRHPSVPFEGGNTTVIVGERDVLVVDAPSYAYVAREDIEEIRRITEKPVRYLVNTHWHNDHVVGNHEYAEAFPGIAIIAQMETATDIALNIPQAHLRAAQPIADEITRTEARIRTGRNEDGSEMGEVDRAAQPALLEKWKAAANDYRNFVFQPPTLTFGDSLDIDIGGRVVRIRHLGRGNTSGDAIVHVPDVDLVATGDLVVHPLPFPYDGYPSEWVRTLDRVGQLEPSVVVPGHGTVLENWTYPNLVRDLFMSAIDQVNARLYVIGPAEFRQVEEVLGHVDLSAFRDRFVGDNPARARSFDRVAETVVRLVFKEAALR
jgi:glyoxylase-like metal-dependent hydrolase (beta-lactamase superfamily II)